MTNKNRKRFFNGQQRVVLFLHAAGRCCACGIELQEGWHGDHVTAFSRGGATDLNNGQALCAACNLKKSNRLPEAQEMTAKESE